MLCFLGKRGVIDGLTRLWLGGRLWVDERLSVGAVGAATTGQTHGHLEVLLAASAVVVVRLADVVLGRNDATAGHDGICGDLRFFAGALDEAFYESQRLAAVGAFGAGGIPRYVEVMLAVRARGLVDCHFWRDWGTRLKRPDGRVPADSLATKAWTGVEQAPHNPGKEDDPQGEDQR